VSSALGASMLPSYPIFNAVITGLLSIPFENFVLDIYQFRRAAHS
jgi:hypothetical protein